MIIFNNTEYFPIPGYEGYFISKSGEVFSNKSKQILRQQTVRKGYKRVTLGSFSEKRTIGVHSLVLLTFVGEKPFGSECRHLNSNPSDNRIENLCYGTAQQNTDDKFRQNRKFQKLNAEKAIAIAKDTRPYQQIAQEYGISYSSVSDIKCGLVWGKVTTGFRYQRGRKTFLDYLFEEFSKEQVLFILDRNNPRKDIMRTLGINIYRVKDIRTHFVKHPEHRDLLFG